MKRVFKEIQIAVLNHSVTLKITYKIVLVIDF